MTFFVCKLLIVISLLSLNKAILHFKLNIVSFFTKNYCNTEKHSLKPEDCALETHSQPQYCIWFYHESNRFRNITISCAFHTGNTKPTTKLLCLLSFVFFFKMTSVLSGSFNVFLFTLCLFPWIFFFSCSRVSSFPTPLPFPLSLSSPVSTLKTFFAFFF